MRKNKAYPHPTDDGASSPAWYVYVLRCADDTLYTGITTDVPRRLAEHNADDRLGARYTRVRRPVRLHYVESAVSRSMAARREWAIKQMTRADKLALCDAAERHPDGNARAPEGN